MRIAGADWQQIADQFGYASRGAACKDVTRALEARLIEQHTSVEMLRQTELIRLDALTREAWAVMKRRHVTVSAGQVVMVVDERTHTETPLVDDKPTLDAIDRLLKIQDRRAKLLGLDAPKKVEVITIDAIDAEIARLTAELGELAAAEAADAAGPAPAQG